jgi:predicted MPP superfamily phosphohydrolase
VETANQRQVGGTHYKTPYEHWDLAIFLDMGCLEYASSKHVTRWRKKDGIKDLRKALHYLDKLIEVYEIYDLHRPCPLDRVKEEVNKFAIANDLTDLEGVFIYRLCTFDSKEELQDGVRGALIWLMQEATEGMTGTPEDGGHHTKYDPK